MNLQMDWTQLWRTLSVTTFHGMFLEWWNFHHLITFFMSTSLLEGIAKICKKLKSHSGFLSYLQNRTANPVNLAAIFCPVLVCPQKATVGIKIFAVPLSSRHEKCYQILERLFVVFHQSRNILWHGIVTLQIHWNLDAPSEMISTQMWILWPSLCLVSRLFAKLGTLLHFHKFCRMCCSPCGNMMTFTQTWNIATFSTK